MRQALELLAAGWTTREIGSSLGVNASTVSRLANKAKKEEGRRVRMKNVKCVGGRFEKPPEERRLALISAARSIQYRAILQGSRVGANLDALREIRDQATSVELELRSRTEPDAEALDVANARLRELGDKLLSSPTLHELAPLDRGGVPAAEPA